MEKTKELHDVLKIPDTEIIKHQNIDIGKLQSEIEHLSFENNNLKIANGFCTVSRQIEFRSLQATLKIRNNRIKELEENYIIVQSDLRKQVVGNERLKVELYKELKNRYNINK